MVYRLNLNLNLNYFKFVLYIEIYRIHGAVCMNFVSSI